MKKKNRNLLFIVVILIASFFILSNSGLVPFSVLTGFTPISLSSINLTTTSVGGLSGDLLLMSFVSGGSGQSAIGTYLAPNEINPEIEGTVERGFRFSSNLTDSECRYPFTRDYQALIDNHVNRYGVIDYKNAFYTCDEVSNRRDCASYGEVADFVVDINPLQFKNECYCVLRNQDSGSVAAFTSPYHYFTTYNILDVDGYPQIGVQIDNLSKSGKSLGDIAYLQWTGNLVSGFTCDQTQVSNFAVINSAKDDGLQTWKIIDRSDIEDYDFSEQSLINILESNPSISSAKAKVNEVNIFADRIRASKENFINNNYVYVKGEDGSEGIFYFDTERAYQYPQFSLFIDADTLGFVQPVGEPTNLVANSTNITTGGSSRINLTWTNVGVGSDFESWVECSTGETSPTKRTFVEQYDSGSVWHEVSANCSTDRTLSCIASVSNVGSVEKQVDTPVSFTCSPEAICDAGIRRCVGDSVYMCSNDGTQENFIADCSLADKVCELGVCVEGDDKDVCGDGVCTGSENFLNCPRDCFCTGDDCGKETCEDYDADGFFVLNYQPKYDFLQRFVGCEPIYNVPLFVSLVLIVGVIIIGGFVFQPFGKKRRRRR